MEVLALKAKCGSNANDGKIIKIDKTYLNKNKAYFSNWKA
jgi:hypothetical protein